MSNINKANCYMKIDKEDYQFTWTIQNIKLIPWNIGTYLESQIFSTQGNEQFFFRLVHEEITRYKIMKTLYLFSKNTVNQFNCHYSGFVYVDGKKVDTLRGIRFFEANKDTRIRLRETEWNGAMFRSGDITTIELRLTLSRGNKTFLGSESITNDIKETKLKLNFDSVFLDKKFSDVMLLTACGKEIPAHKVVLAAASPVFKAMFSHDMLENKIQSVDIIDISYETAVEFLRYVYTGGVETREVSLVIDLLAAADKYQVNELKNLCEELLNSNLSTENALEILKVADKYDMKSLKKIATDFIKLHIIGPSNSDDLGKMILSMEQFFSKKFSS